MLTPERHAIFFRKEHPPATVSTKIVAHAYIKRKCQTIFSSIANKMFPKGKKFITT